MRELEKKKKKKHIGKRAPRGRKHTCSGLLCVDSAWCAHGGRGYITVDINICDDATWPSASWSRSMTCASASVTWSLGLPRFTVIGRACWVLRKSAWNLQDYVEHWGTLIGKVEHFQHQARVIACGIYL